MQQVAQRLGAYLKHRMPEARDLEVASISRIHGGASRETYRVRVKWTESGAGKSRERGMVLRREPEACLLETRSEIEYRAYEAAFKAGIPVPEPLFYEQDSTWLERPFIVMAEIENCNASFPLMLEPYGAHAKKLGEQFFSWLGKIAAQDPAQLGLVGVMEDVATQDCWQRELAYWEKVINEDALGPEPAARAAIRWLRRNPPPPAQKICLVHGDYRAGNFLFNAEGDIKAILDWELAHLGDPLEDLCWALDPLWAFRQPRRAGGMIDRDEACRIWQQVSGLKIDPLGLRWWELFSHLKGLAIWISACKEYHSGANSDPVLAVASGYSGKIHTQLIADRLYRLNEEQRG